MVKRCESKHICDCSSAALLLRYGRWIGNNEGESPDFAKVVPFFTDNAGRFDKKNAENFLGSTCRALVSTLWTGSGDGRARFFEKRSLTDMSEILIVLQIRRWLYAQVYPEIDVRTRGFDQKGEIFVWIHFDSKGDLVRLEVEKSTFSSVYKDMLLLILTRHLLVAPRYKVTGGYRVPFQYSNLLKI